MNNILERISQIADLENITIGKIEQKIGASKGVLYKAIQKGSDIQSKWLVLIVENFPLYRAEWLLTGKGDIHKKRNEQTEIISVDKEKDKEISRLSTENARLEETNELLRFKITTLESQLSERSQIKNSPIIHTAMAESKPELTKKNQKK